MLIRRTKDEVVCTPSDNTLSGNRGNMLLTKLFVRRYPHLFLKSLECAVLLLRFLSTDISARSKKILHTHYKFIFWYHDAINVF